MSKKNNRSPDKRAQAKRTTKRDAKPSFGSRIKRWFSNIISELKRVIWPDKKKLRQSTATVLLIIAIAALLILFFDSAIGFILRTTGFYSAKALPDDNKIPPIVAPVDPDKTTPKTTGQSTDVTTSGELPKATAEE